MRDSRSRAMPHRNSEIERYDERYKQRMLEMCLPGDQQDGKTSSVKVSGQLGVSWPAIYPVWVTTTNSSCLTASGRLRREMNYQETSCGRRSSILCVQAFPLVEDLRKTCAGSWIAILGPCGHDARRICDATATTSNPPPTCQAS